jgi:hypothetical protein
VNGIPEKNTAVRRKSAEKDYTIAAKQMAMMPMKRPARVLNKALPLPETGRGIREPPFGVKKKWLTIV